MNYKKPSIVLSILAIQSLALAKEPTVDSSFVTCKGKVSLSESGAQKSLSNGSIQLVPYQNKQTGQIAFKAVITVPTGKYEVQPIDAQYSLIRQAITYSYDSADGNLELGVGLDEKAKVAGKPRGDFGLELHDAKGTLIVGTGLGCTFSKAMVD